jgi:hypothetical protein
MEFIKPELVNSPGLSVSQHDGPANKVGLSLIELGEDCARCHFNAWHDVARIGGGRFGVAHESAQLVANARHWDVNGTSFPSADMVSSEITVPTLIVSQ